MPQTQPRSQTHWFDTHWVCASAHFPQSFSLHPPAPHCFPSHCGVQAVLHEHVSPTAPQSQHAMAPGHIWPLAQQGVPPYVHDLHT